MSFVAQIGEYGDDRYFEYEATYDDIEKAIKEYGVDDVADLAERIYNDYSDEEKQKIIRALDTGDDDGILFYDENGTRKVNWKKITEEDMDWVISQIIFDDKKERYVDEFGFGIEAVTKEAAEAAYREVDWDFENDNTYY